MHLQLRLDLAATRRWQVDLVGRLEARPGWTVEVQDCPAPAPLPRNAERFFHFESMVHGRPGEDAASPAPDGLRGRPNLSGPPDLVIDLAGNAATGTGRVWRLLYDGAPGEAPLFGALRAGRSPLAELREGEHPVAAGRLGTELPGRLRASFADALTRTGTLIRAALDGAPTAWPLSDTDAQTASSDFGPLDLGFAVGRKLLSAAAERVRRLRLPDPNWRVGWRRLDGPDLFDLRRHPPGGWTTLPDDGKRFYADPFPIAHGGRVHLFVEEYPYATGKGIISSVPFGPDGPDGVPEPVLELPYHLSYPFVFERDGDVWMIPESCTAHTVDLFRATKFPTGWVKEATLIAGVAASDSTLVEHAGRWWLFATVRGTELSSSDALHLWSAPDFRGPWEPHPKNPVLIDNASARPAGRLVERDGVLWRPVQDCRTAYGAALGLARVLRLDRDGFDQKVEAILGAGPLWPGSLMHTLNRAGGLEFIDGSGIPRSLFAR